MWRSLIPALIIYGLGHPSLDDYRPTALNRPFQAFYLEINQFARDGHTALRAFGESPWMRNLKAYIDQMDTRLRGRSTSGTARANPESQ